MLRRIIDVQGDTIMEQAMLELITDGTITRHIKKATALYKFKRDYTAKLLDAYLSAKANYVIPEGGLAFWIVPKVPVNWERVILELKEKGIRLDSPEHFSFDTPVNSIRLGYASLSEEQLERVIAV